MKIHLGDFCVFAGALAGLVFVVGMATGEHKTHQQIATECEPQPGSVLAYSYQDKSGVTCAYIEAPRPAYGRAVRKQKATKI